MTEGVEERLAAYEEGLKSCKRRLDAVEKQQEAIHELAGSIKVMASEQKHQTEAINRLECKVDVLETKPAKRWDGLVDKLVWGIVGALLAFMLAQIGIG